MRAKKRLGQNFLIDNNVINKIIDEVSATEDDLIIEIGPGRGALTKLLKMKNANLICYELDKDLKEYLTPLEDDKTKIIYQDILNSDIKKDINGINYNKIYIVGNLPYYITTPIIEHIIAQKIDFEKFTIMVQKEVADRFMAKSKTKDYGYMTLVIEYYFDTKKVCNVSKNSFNPSPKVESTVLSFYPKKIDKSIDINKYFNFLKKCFSQKRKTLKNNLKEYDWLKIKKILDSNELGENVRAEEIQQSIFIKMYKRLFE